MLVAVSMLGNVVLGLGVALEVFAGAAALPGEGLVLAVSTVLRQAIFIRQNRQ
ncbi:hypothetical protein [Parasutterella sp.]|uniref:hypothetical protein n=1 Tax=Parasutterella sp. TaxID=2049037 RepID=UPI003520CAE3